ncbi:hypothetical protein [Agrococcus sp. Marseille-P2731]|uniref:hypothetical protein n=1 Tax=Agrococcus sp. Marseille-P2731 TaxID=1841862 RepID=UPI0011606082|nr:hypothetical protein [Agrococcus sp. Marseille-P2731]
MPTPIFPEADSVLSSIEAVHAVAPSLWDVVPFDERLDGAAGESQSSSVTAGSDVSVTSDHESVTIGLDYGAAPTEIVVATPIAAASDAEFDLNSGASVSQSDELAIDQVTEATESSVRMTSVLDNSSALDRLQYTFEGAVLFEAEDGSVEVGLAGDEVGALIIGQVEQPWAIDANGTPLDTHYSVDGDNLTQHVELQADTAFPVVADPHFVWTNNTNNFEIKWTRSETVALANGGYGPAIDFAASCGAFKFLPPAVRGALFATCLDAYARFVTAAKIQKASGIGCIKINGDTSPVWVLGPLPYTCVKS